ncbi:MAG: AsmA family protein, partial [Pseudomonadota bacterium]
MKRVLIILGVIVGLLLLAAAIVPFLIPTSVYKAQIEKAATNATGREVVLEGDPSLSIFPSISVKIDGASVSNPEGFSADQMITAGEFKANVKLWPLFSSRVEVAQITLSDATVNLERLSSGEANWVFTPTGEAQEDTSDAPETAETETDPAAAPAFETNIARARLRNANVYYNDRTTDTQYALTEVDIEARLTALNAPLISSGSGRLNGQAFAYDIDLDTVEDLMLARPASLIASLETDYGTVSYDGALTLGETPSVDGGFSVTSQTLSSLIAFFGADLPIRADALKRIDIEGRVSGPTTALLIDLSKTDLRAEGLELDYTGTINLAEIPSLNGRVALRADNPGQLLKPDAQIAALGIVNDLNFTADVSGPAETPSLDNINLTHRGPLLDADYTGRLSLGGQGALNGQLSANSDDLRGLLGALDVELPDGDRLRSFSIKGNTSGSFEGLSLADITLDLDDLSATGKLGADISGARPKLTANLSMPRLDLTPFLGTEDAPAQTMEDWDDTPLALDSLRMLDADLTLNAGEVVINEITLQDALLVTTLNNGVLRAIFRRAENQPGFRAFDGAWAGDMTLNASTAVPSVSIDATAEGVAAEKLFEALTGFNRLGGIGRVELDLSSE